MEGYSQRMRLKPLEGSLLVDFLFEGAAGGRGTPTFGDMTLVGGSRLDSGLCRGWSVFLRPAYVITNTTTSGRQYRATRASF